METAADAVHAHATKAGLADVTAQHLAERDTARLRQASRLRTAAARRADELIEAHSKALGKAEAAATEAAKVRNRLGQAEQTAAEKNAEVEAAITTTADTLSTWIQGVDERIRPSAETAESWASLVAGLSEKVSPSPVLAMAISREHLIPVRRPHEDGELTGTASPRRESPKLLGAAARAADRIRRAEQIRKRISDLADDHELMSLELDDVVGLLGALDTASDHLPSDSDVVTAVLAARDAAKRVRDLQTEAEDARQDRRRRPEGSRCVRRDRGRALRRARSAPYAPRGG